MEVVGAEALIGEELLVVPHGVTGRRADLAGIVVIRYYLDVGDLFNVDFVVGDVVVGDWEEGVAKCGGEVKEDEGEDGDEVAAVHSCSSLVDEFLVGCL